MSSCTTEQASLANRLPPERLKALPARYYTDHAILAKEKERLFFKAWQYACHMGELDSPGAYVTVEILGQNLLVLRGEDDEIRAFYNVCPHRGHKLVEGSGTKRMVVCPYHQWSFSLDGKLRRQRKESTTLSPDEALLCLHPVRVDHLLDFVFINLDPEAASIADFWPGAEEHLRATCPDIGSYTLSQSASAIQPTDVAANWKVQIDNFLECQHCRYGHKTFSDMLDVCHQKQELHENHSYVFIPGAGKVDSLAYPLNPDYDVMDLHFWFLFPNIGFGQFSGPGNLSLFQWTPVGPDRTIRISVSLDVSEPTDPGMIDRRDRRAAWCRDVLQPEDISFMESVQQGMSQRCFKHGWYLVDWDNEELSEVMVRHFHDLYLSHMEE